MEDLKDSNKGKKNDVAENGSFAEIRGEVEEAGVPEDMGFGRPANSNPYLR